MADKANCADFDFEMDSLNSLEIESHICNHCRIGEPIRSNLSMSILPSFKDRVDIYADDGRVECTVTVTLTQSEAYLVSVTSVHVTGKRGKPYRP